MIGLPGLRGKFQNYFDLLTRLAITALFQTPFFVPNQAHREFLDLKEKREAQDSLVKMVRLGKLAKGDYKGKLVRKVLQVNLVQEENEVIPAFQAKLEQPEVTESVDQLDHR